MAKSSEPTGPNAFVSEAYNLDDKKNIVDFYGKWAEDYDHQMIDNLGYTSPATISKKLAEFVPDTKAEVFDVGCGTGLTCSLLKNLGYSNLDGIDLSPDMVKIAGQRNIYRSLIVGDVNLPLDIKDNSYDAAISSGTFTHGHVGPEPLDEIFRIIRPGGILACTVHHDLWQIMGFEAKFEALINLKQIECLSIVEDKYYEKGELEGWFCVYRKL